MTTVWTILGVVHRQQRLVAATALGILALCAAITFTLQPIYSSTALILVDPSRKNLLESQSPLAASNTDSARIDSEVEILRSDSVLLAALAAGALPRAAPAPAWRNIVSASLGFATPPEPDAEPTPPLDALRASLSVQRRGVSYLIAVQARSPDPAQAAQTANLVAGAYIAHQLNSKIAAALTARDVIATQLREQAALLAPTGAAHDTTPTGEQYQLLLTRARELQIQAGLQLADSRIASPALPPLRPGFPNHGLILLLAGIAALGGSVSIALFYENHLGGFTSDAQLAAVLKRPIAPAIPHARPKNAREGIADLVVSAPGSEFAGAIRRLCASVNHALRPPPGQPAIGHVIMMASAGAGEGKTTLALAVARSFGLSGFRTLIIDADLHAPALHRQLRLTPSLGLFDFLCAPAMGNIAAHIVPDELSGIHAILGANHHAGSDQLLSGPVFSHLIAAARRTFDIVIIDAPALQPMADGLYIARQVDSIILLTRWASTTQRRSRQAMASLLDANNHASITTIINAAPSKTKPTRNNLAIAGKQPEHQAEAL
ncbi:MAG TPA: Wzz/FepE/Etk N-terminal domain-containing protein [Devosia sp.]|nr:Wzz/FepE/Etk N-terminal domain-containing protein [Devosia sp.]